MGREYNTPQLKNNDKTMKTENNFLKKLSPVVKEKIEAYDGYELMLPILELVYIEGKLQGITESRKLFNLYINDK